ncbi:MAG: hypothetical protein QM676_14470 [Novosphingobium sp.]
MAKVSVMTPEKARRLEGGALEYFGGDAPIHLHAHELAAGAELGFEPWPVERLVYVRTGAAELGGTALPQGSVAIVERGAAAALRGAEACELLVFHGAAPAIRAGGHVHLLPRDRAPRVPSLGASGVGGTLFADAQCPTCAVWLHENRFPAGAAAPASPEAGIHSHEEDEIIFVTGGAMLLGNRRVGPGTAIAIAADTMYSFLPAPEGLTFINFRAGLPREIHFADGRSMDEVGIWNRVDRPLEYL